MDLKLLLCLAKKNKVKTSLYLLLVIFLPPLEAMSLSLVYLILSPEKASLVLTKILGFMGLTYNPAGKTIYYIIAITAVISIVFLAIGRAIKIRLQVSIKDNIYQSYLARLAEMFLAMPGWAVVKGNDKVFSNVALNEAESIGATFISYLTVIYTIVIILVLSITSLTYSPAVVAISLVLGLCSILLNSRKINSLKRISVEKFNAQKELISHVNQLIKGFERIKFDGLEAVAMKKFRHMMKKDRSWRVVKALTKESVSIFSDSFNGISALSIVFFGVVFFSVKPEVFVVLLLVFSRIRNCINVVQSEIVVQRGYREGMRATLDLINELESYHKGKEPIVEGDIKGIKISNVDFSLGGKSIYKNLAMEIRSGDRVLLQGPSGQGKSTLLKILAGFYVPSRGKIEILTENGEIPLTFKGIRPFLFYSSNELYVFDDTIKSALDYEGTHTNEKIFNAFKESCLLEAVNGMSNGMDTVIGDDGQNISLGQRQRLILARLFLVRPSIIILDEVTSNLDKETEGIIFNNIRNYIDKNAILIVATHREAKNIKFNKIIRVENTEIKINQIYN